MSSATLRVRLGVTAATVIAGFGLTTALSSSASASTTLARPGIESAALRTHSAHVTKAQRQVRRHDKLVREVLAEARKQRGKPYVYGADGPGAFDCSGLVRYVFLHSVHRDLPHNAAAQFHALHHISRRHLEPGDLVFTDDGGISHVGIFAGHHHWWVAPHTGTHVQLQEIYRAHFVYARVLRHP